MAIVDKSFSTRDVLLERSSTKRLTMQPNSVSGRQQQLGLLMGRSQPDVLEAARVAALLNGQPGSLNLQSGFGTGLGSGSLAGLGGAPSGFSLGLGSLNQAPQSQPQPAQLALPDQLALLSQFPHALFPQQYSSERDLQLGSIRNVGKTRSSDSRSSSAYASRHQAAEQRRRTRINERLELLRKLVPHAERANTACFLEEVIKYIEALKRRTLELESMLEAATGKPVAKSLSVAGGLPSGLDASPDSQAPSPRHPTSASGQGAAAAAQQLLGNCQSVQAAAGATSGAGANASSPLLQSAGLSGSQPIQQLQAETTQNQLHPSPSLHQHQQLQLSQATGTQRGHLLSSGGPSQSGGQLGSSHAGLGSSSQPQPQAPQLIFQQPGSGVSLSTLGGGGSGGLGGARSLAHMTAGLQAGAQGLASHLPAHLSSTTAHHHLSASHGYAHHAAAQHMAQQLSDLQSIHVMQSLQQHHQSRTAGHHPHTFHPINNKAFLHFNEDLFGGIKPELLQPSRSLMGAATTSATPSNSLQLTTAHLPTDSNVTLMQQVEMARRTLSDSPGTSEESGVPLKKRKVLLL